MIRYIHHSEIDKKKWDACILKSRYSILYGYSWYLDVISPQWDALVLNDYSAVFPLTWKKKYGVYYLTQPLFAQQLGIFSVKDLTRKDILNFLKAIPRKFVHIDINLNPGNLDNLDERFTAKIKKTYHVQLHDDYGLIANKYFHDTKRILRKPSTRQLMLRESSVEEVIFLYKHNVWQKTPGVKSEDFKTLKTLAEVVALHEKTLIVSAYDGETLCAAGVFFVCSHKIIFLFGSSSAAGRKNDAMRFILDQVIKRHCKNQIVLDFEGSSVDSVEYVYRSFGSEKIVFYNIRGSRSNFLKIALGMKQKLDNVIMPKKIKKLIGN